MKITLENGPFATFLLRAPNGQSILIQTDYDFPGVASSFGWCACHCGETDGTVDCPHRTASAMIAAAREFLDDKIGESVDDPGYF
ncbi:MAG: hypothetical protein AAB403_12035 [Planctomycetota bacterium]